MDFRPGLKRKWLWNATFLLFHALSCFANEASAAATLARTEEIILPSYLQGVLTEHLPIVDIITSGERGLWLISKGSLWLWRLESKGLTHMNLDQGDPSHAPLQVLGSDGIAIFAASKSNLYQIIWPDRRIFRYSLPHGPDESTLGFSGSGDDFRIVHTRGILRFDRYGKTVKLEQPFRTSLKEGKVKYHPQDNTLWRIQGKILEKANANEPNLNFKMLLKTHYPLTDLTDDGVGMAVHTPYALLRISNIGKIIKSIPVEGRRSLLAMNLTKQSHAYIFSDGLLEIYRPANSSAVSAKINLPSDAKIKKLVIEDDLIGVLTDKGVHAFRITQTN
jgi:hypothetical protein